MSKIFLASTFATLLCASLAAQATQQPPSPSTPRVSPPAAGADSPAPDPQRPPDPQRSPDPPRSPDPQSSQRAPATAKADSITIEGCIQRGAASATAGTTGTTASASASGPAFMLTSAMKPAGSSSPTTVASSYRLDAEASKLTPHVGHKVEISGTVEPAAGAAGASGAPGASTPGGATSAAPATPTLKVDNVKMLAANCTP